MERTPPLLLALLVLGSLLAGLAGWVWITIPPTPDPATLPSQSLDPAESLRAVVGQGRVLARELAAEEKLPSLSLAVSIHGDTVWAEAFGWADLETRQPVAPTTRFRVGGASEILTTVAVARLVQEGRLDLDAPVHRYLPSLPAARWAVTTRQLMSHTAGLPAHRGEGGLYQGVRCADDGERLALAASKPPLPDAGTEVRYSTLGWVLVGAVAAAVAGEPYLDLVERRVLSPLGLESTCASGGSGCAAAAARAYYPRLMLDPRWGVHDSPEIDLSCYLPAIGFLSTPTDLVRLGSALIDDGPLSTDVRRELHRAVPLSSGEPSRRTPGWTVARLPAGAQVPAARIFGHGLVAPVVRRPLSATTVGGAVAGSTATLLAVPEHALVVAVASNVSGAANVPLLARRLTADFVRALATP